MSASALTIMLISWGVIAFYTIRFFLKVLKTPQKDD